MQNICIRLLRVLVYDGYIIMGAVADVRLIFYFNAFVRPWIVTFGSFVAIRIDWAAYAVQLFFE